LDNKKNTGICYSHHVTIGTSLLRNASLQKNSQFTQEEIDLLSNCARSNVEAEKECGRRAGNRRDELLDKLRSYLFNNPFGVSAEINSMEPFLNEKMVDKVTFYYYSDSGAAQLVYLLLEEFLKEIYNIEVKSSPIEGESNLAIGLPRLMNSIRENAKNDAKCLTLLNITPGFKAETAYSMVGIVFSAIPALAYYKFETMKYTVGIPIFYRVETIKNTISELEKKVNYELEKLSKDELVLTLAARLNLKLPLKGKVSQSDLDWAKSLIVSI